MKDKLNDLLKSEGLKPGQFAEMLGINPAGVSHILAGRNKPGFDLLQKILRRFPQINPDWLLLDSSQMYRDETPRQHPLSSTQGIPTSDLFAAAPRSAAADLSAPHSAAAPETTPSNRTASDSRRNFPVDPRKTVERVVVFYTDQTFDSYSPTKR